MMRRLVRRKPGAAGRIQEDSGIACRPRKWVRRAFGEHKAAELIARGKTIVLIPAAFTRRKWFISFKHAIAHPLSPQTNLKSRRFSVTRLYCCASLNPDGVDMSKTGTQNHSARLTKALASRLYTNLWAMNTAMVAFTQVETKITVDRITTPGIRRSCTTFISRVIWPRLFSRPTCAPSSLTCEADRRGPELGNWMAGSCGQKDSRASQQFHLRAWTPRVAISLSRRCAHSFRTASARIASPLTLNFDQLRTREGYDPQKV